MCPAHPPFPTTLEDLTPYQQEFVSCPARYTVVEAATKTGKTTACLIWLLDEALRVAEHHHQPQVWWLAPTLAQARMAYRRMKALLAARKLSFTATETRLTLTLSVANDPKQILALLCFRTAEEPDNLFGEDVWAAVVDEATRCREESWVALRTTLTATCGPVKIIGNVKGNQNWVRRLVQLALADAPSARPALAAIHGRRDTDDLAAESDQGPPLQTATDEYRYFNIRAEQAVQAGLIGSEELADARRTLPEDVYRELYECVPRQDGANPFGHEHLRACVVPALSTQPALYWGIDLGKAHDFTVAIGLDAHGHLAHFERFRAPWNVCLPRLAALVGQRPAGVDSTGVGDAVVEQLRTQRPNVQGFLFTSRSKQQLMEALAVAVQQRAVAFPEGPLLEELLAFEYHANGPHGVQYAAPHGLHDDCVCALALALHCRLRHGHRAPGFDFAF
jgi:hypothetical protein